MSNDDSKTTNPLEKILTIISNIKNELKESEKQKNMFTNDCSEDEKSSENEVASHSLKIKAILEDIDYLKDEFSNILLDIAAIGKTLEAHQQIILKVVKNLYPDDTKDLFTSKKDDDKNHKPN